MALADREPETVVAELRPNAAGLILPAILLVAAAGAAGYFGFRLPEEWMRWAALGAAALIVLLGFVLPLVRWLGKRYTLTTRRTIIREGVFARQRREVLHTRVLEVIVRRNPGQLVAGSGDVVLELEGGRSAVLRSVRAPGLVQEAISDLVEAQHADRARRRASGDSGLTR